MSKQLTSLQKRTPWSSPVAIKGKTGPTAGVMVLLERGDMNASAAFSPAQRLRWLQVPGALSLGTIWTPGNTNFLKPSALKDVPASRHG